MDHHARIGQAVALALLLHIGVSPVFAQQSEPIQVTSGIQYQLGPMSKVNPCSSNCLHRPPGVLFFSKTITSCPSFARYAAHERLEKPVPITAIFDIAGYTYGPLLGLYTFGLYTRRQVRDRFVPVICVVAPLLTYIISANSAASFCASASARSRRISSSSLWKST